TVTSPSSRPRPSPKGPTSCGGNSVCRKRQPAPRTRACRRILCLRSPTAKGARLLSSTLNPELNRLLKGVSRSFYLTLRVLPRSIRPQIGLAYLLARTGDTMADTELLSAEARLAALESLRARILGQSTAPLSFGEIARH